MKNKIPTTATEIVMRISQETRDELLKWLNNGGLVGREIELNISHWNGGELGTVKAEIKSWKYDATPERPNPNP